MVGGDQLILDKGSHQTKIRFIPYHPGDRAPSWRGPGGLSRAQTPADGRLRFDIHYVVMDIVYWNNRINA